MTGKRRRASVEVNTAKPAKRTKFTLEKVALPTTTKIGVVLVTGSGDVGQLGLGPDVLEKNRPTLVNLKEEIVDVCAGGMHTVCLTKQGKVLTFGCNDEGALGRLTTDKEDAEFEAGAVELPGKAIQVSAGDSHTAALLDDGRVFAWGTFRDSHGNMGMSRKGNEKLPFEIFPNHHVVKIASGADHVVFLTNSGAVFTCGCAEQGQLGRTSLRGSSRNARSGVGKDQIAKLLEPAQIYLKPTLKLHFDDIWAGTYGTFAKVADKNDIYVFGLNNCNQLGLKNFQIKFVEAQPDKFALQFLPTLSQEFSKHQWQQISSAQHHTLALNKSGKIFSIGRKEYGRLGLGENCEDAITLKEITKLADAKIVNVSCGSSSSFAVNDKGQLYAWGMGSVGQLGTGEDEDCFEPTLIKGKQLIDRHVFRVSSGGQHTVILATTNNNLPEGNGKTDDAMETT